MIRFNTTAFVLGAALSAIGFAAQAGVSVKDADAWALTPYQCKGEQPLDVRFSPDGAYAAIDQMGERILLKQVPSGSGARYQAMDKDYSYVLDTKGEWAALYEAGDKIVLDDCHTMGN